MSRMSASLCLAQEVGAELGVGQVLFETLCRASGQTRQILGLIGCKLRYF